MSIAIESLFTKALGLQAPWGVKEVELDTARHRIDFTLTCDAKQLSCPLCQAPEQGIHDRLPSAVAPSGLLSVRGVAAR